MWQKQIYLLKTIIRKFSLKFIDTIWWQSLGQILIFKKLSEKLAFSSTYSFYAGSTQKKSCLYLSLLITRKYSLKTFE